MPAVADAHPHVFIKSNIDFISDGARVTQIEVNWTFDPMFTEQVMVSCDRNRNRRIDPGEVSLVRKGFFRNLAHSKYFLYMWVNGVFVKTHSVSSFLALTDKDGNLVFRFRVPLTVPASGSVKLKIMNNDPEIFVAFMSRPGTSRIKGSLAGGRAVNNAKSQFQLSYGP